MKKIILILIAVLTCACGSLAAPEMYFTMVRPPNAPYFVSSQSMNVYSDDYKTVVLEIRSNKRCTARLLWSSSYDPQINLPKSVWFVIKRSDYPEEYVFNIRSQNQYWTGFIDRIAVFPEDDINGIEITSSKVIPADLISTVASGWREFWGPGGRVVLGSTVNNMAVTTLWGRSINIYLFILIMLSALASSVYYLIRTKDPALSWKVCGRVAIISGMLLWAVLELSFLVNEYGQLRSDVEKYDLKTLEEKQKLTIGEDLYAFISFCAKEIPGRAAVKPLSAGPNAEFFKGRESYYLTPMNFNSEKPDYLIVYGYDKDMKSVLREHPGFRIYKKYNEGAYILWTAKK